MVSNGTNASNIGQVLKATSGWYFGSNGTDQYGFNALPGGQLNWSYSGSFEGAGTLGAWWTSTTSGMSTYVKMLTSDSDELTQGVAKGKRARSIRCIQNGPSLVVGCMDPAYLEFDSQANYDPGDICGELLELGCKDEDYLEYNANAMLTMGVA